MILVRSKCRARTTGTAKWTLIFLQIMQLIVISVEYLIAMFTVLECYIR